MTATISPTAAALIESHQGLVRSLALQVLRRTQMSADLDDLVAYGQVGLAEAAQQFDPERGTQFSTYAYYRIRGAIYDGISKMTWMGADRGRRARFQRMTGEVLENDQQSSPAPDQSRTAESESAWLVRLAQQLSVVYLASGLAEELTSDSESDEGKQPSEAVMRRELHDRLHCLIDELPVEERGLVRGTYFDGLTLQQAADQAGISKSWASRLHGKALQRLAAGLRRSGLAD